MPPQPEATEGNYANIACLKLGTCTWDILLVPRRRSTATSEQGLRSAGLGFVVAGLGLWFVRAQPPCVLCLLSFS